MLCSRYVIVLYKTQQWILKSETQYETWILKYIIHNYVPKYNYMCICMSVLPPPKGCVNTLSNWGNVSSCTDISVHNPMAHKLDFSLSSPSGLISTHAISWSIVEWLCIYVRVCVCMYLYVCVCMYVYVCECMYVCVCMCMYVYVCVCMCVYMYVCMYVCVCLCVWCLCVWYVWMNIFYVYIVYGVCVLCVYCVYCVWCVTCSKQTCDEHVILLINNI